MTKASNQSHPSMSRSLDMVSNILHFDLVQEIRKRQKKNKRISIMDLGCGVGRALWELSSRFSGKDSGLQLVGVFHGRKLDKKSVFYQNQKRMEEVHKDPTLTAHEFKIDYKNKIIPKLFNQNIDHGLRFENSTFDIVYSNNAFHFFKQKVLALTEVSRVLQVGGIAVLTIDRTDMDFWSDNLYFPRLRIYKNGKLLNAKRLIQNKDNICFDVQFRKMNSYGTGKDSYVVTMRKKREGQLYFPELSFNPNKSFDLDNIRASEGDMEHVREYKKLITIGGGFKKKPKKEYFGGYLSCYEYLVP